MAVKLFIYIASNATEIQQTYVGLTSL